MCLRGLLCLFMRVTVMQCVNNGVEEFVVVRPGSCDSFNYVVCVFGLQTFCSAPGSLWILKTKARNGNLQSFDSYEVASVTLFGY